MSQVKFTAPELESIKFMVEEEIDRNKREDGSLSALPSEQPPLESFRRLLRPEWMADQRGSHVQA